MALITKIKAYREQAGIKQFLIFFLFLGAKSRHLHLVTLSSITFTTWRYRAFLVFPVFDSCERVKSP